MMIIAANTHHRDRRVARAPLTQPRPNCIKNARCTSAADRREQKSEKNIGAVPLRVIEPATPAAAGVIYTAAAAAVTHLATLAGVRLDRAHPFGCAQIFIARSMHAFIFDIAVHYMLEGI
jgi:hypothetical protein